MRCLRGYIRPFQPLLEDYHSLCPDFNLEMVEASAQDFHILELTRAIFYVIVLNDALTLGVACVYMLDALVPVLEWLNWGTFESWLELKSEDLL